jgi:uncharacterized protein (TIGR02646 family)
MIHVDRAVVSEPAALQSEPAEAERKRAQRFFRRPAERRAQQSFDFDASIFASDEVRTALTELFRGKCAYCEQPLPASALVVDHFRPRAGAVGLDGSFSLEHYWWLAYEWANLYASCPECSLLKGLRFPVEGERQSRRREPTDRALLLDPCTDDPEQHLVFLDDGRVATLDERGRVTIEVLGLNRSSLVAARLAALHELRTEPEAVFDPAGPFAALRRQFAGGATRMRVRALGRGFAEAQAAQDDYSIADESEQEAYFIRMRLVERIVIRNLRIVKDLELELPRAAWPQQAPWLTLLGENGSGKSSVLHAVGLALMGEEYRDTLGLDASKFLRRRARAGFVEVYLTGSSEPIRLEFNRDSPRFGGSPPEPKVLLLGYGATRLLPRGDARPQTDRTVGRVDNLYNPFVPLGDAVAWLLALDDDAFASIARTLRILLLLDETERVERHGDRIDVGGVPLEHLSDGFQSLLALAADIVAVMISRWPAMEAAEGIVLIDELDAHLHPRWRMRIVQSLRDVFPRVQFLASSNDPLCLRGLRNGEVVVMRRNEKNEAVVLTDVPPVEGLRVDQLLTSEFFGLYSTIDPGLDQLFDEYYLLKAKPRLTKAEAARQAELDERLAELQVLGSTRRERLVLEAADDFLARERRTVEPGERLALKSETKQKIVDVWERVAAGKEI